MSGRIDEIIERDDGWREEIRYNASWQPFSNHSQTRKIIDPQGRTREVWHEVFDSAGNLIHRDAKHIAKGDES